MPINYHFTSLENWENIKKEGYLRCYPTGSLDKKGSLPTKGIWLWENKLSGDSLVGAILYQMNSKRTPRAVELKVKTDKSNIILFNSKFKIINYVFSLGEFEIQTDVQPFIYSEDIPIEDIELIKTYKFEEAFK